MVFFKNSSLKIKSTRELKKMNTMTIYMDYSLSIVQTIGKFIIKLRIYLPLSSFVASNLTIITVIIYWTKAHRVNVNVPPCSIKFIS